MPPTQLPVVSREGWAQRLAALIPHGWAGDDAMQSGLVHDFLGAAGGELLTVLNELLYVLLASRLQTETAPELDYAGIDYLGDLLPRPAGMSDADYSALIIASIFRDAATRPAIAAALTRLTGATPRMLESWSIFDTGVWGGASYWNVDTVANPARWAGSDRYQGFIETVPARIPAIGANNPIWGWGSGPLGPYWNVPGYFFGTIQTQSDRAVYDMVSRLKAEGTTVWVKLLSTIPAGSIVLPSAVQSLAAVSSGQTQITVSWQPPSTGTPPFSYLVEYRSSNSPSWVAGSSQFSTGAVITGLTSGTDYFVRVTASNSAGATVSSAVAVSTPKIPPAQATGLVATQVQSSAITVTWQPPAVGTPPFTYTVQYRITGTVPWTDLPVGQSVGVTILGLQPSTQYDIQVISSNV